MPKDIFYGTPPGMNGPFTAGFAITPADGSELPNVTRGIWVGGAGDVALVFANGGAVTLKAVPAGTMLWVRAMRVGAATTATNLTGLY